MASPTRYRTGLLSVSDEALAAMDGGRGVVALESTILALGLPHPDDVEIADQIGAAARGGGSAPATIALIDGIVHIRLDATQVGRICADPAVAKLSVRDADVAAAIARLS